MTLGPREHSSVLCACCTAVSAARSTDLYVRRRTVASDIGLRASISHRIKEEKMRLLLGCPTIFVAIQTLIPQTADRRPVRSLYHWLGPRSGNDKLTQTFRPSSRDFTGVVKKCAKFVLDFRPGRL